MLRSMLPTLVWRSAAGRPFFKESSAPDIGPMLHFVPPLVASNSLVSVRAACVLASTSLLLVRSLFFLSSDSFVSFTKVS